MALSEERISTLEAPVFVSEDEASDYAGQGYDDFEAGAGWYIEAMVQVSESSHGEFWVGSEVRKYFGPYDTEQEARLAIASETNSLVAL